MGAPDFPGRKAKQEANMARTAEDSAAETGAVDTNENTADGTTSPAPAAAASDGTKQQVMLTLDEQGAKDYGNGADGNPTPVGTQVRRKDYILRRWSQVANTQRGLIAKELTRIEGRKVPYQIVFQATKGVPNTNVAVAAAAPAPATPEAPQG